MALRAGCQLRPTSRRPGAAKAVVWKAEPTVPGAEIERLGKEDFDAEAVEFVGDLVLVDEPGDAGGEPGLGEVGRAGHGVDLGRIPELLPHRAAEIAVDRMDARLLVEARVRHQHVG